MNSLNELFNSSSAGNFFDFHIHKFLLCCDLVYSEEISCKHINNGSNCFGFQVLSSLALNSLNQLERTVRWNYVNVYFGEKNISKHITRIINCLNPFTGTSLFLIIRLYLFRKCVFRNFVFVTIIKSLCKFRLLVNAASKTWRI